MAPQHNKFRIRDYCGACVKGHGRAAGPGRAVQKGAGRKSTAIKRREASLEDNSTFLFTLMLNRQCVIHLIVSAEKEKSEKWLSVKAGRFWRRTAMRR